MAAMIKMNPLHAAMTPIKPAMGDKMPGAMLKNGLGGAHFTKPAFIEAGHNTTKPPKGNTRKTGTYKGKSNALGHGGRAQQLRDKGVPEGVIGAIARRKGAAPGQAHYHGGKK